MKRTLSIVLSLVLLFSLMATTVTAAEAPVAAEQKPVRTYIPGAASTSDPFAHSNLNDRVWQLNVFEPLVSYNGTSGEYEPRVAENWEISEDGLEYIFHIREGVKFHNGDDCKAEEVKSSLEYGMQSAYNVLYSGIIDTVEVVDEYTVKVILKSPNAAFLHNNDRIFIINTKVAEEQGDQYGVIENLSGTGPYYIDYYDADVEINLKRFDDYYFGAAQIPEVNFKILTDINAALMAFESGDLDFVEVPSSNFEAIKSQDRFTTFLGQTPQLVFLAVNNHHSEPLGNKKLRQALAYAIDYESVNIAGMEGYGSTDGKLMYAPLTIGATEDYGMTYSYDPDMARQLLAEAGYADGVDVGELLAIAGIFHEKVAQVIQANWADVGIQSTVRTMEQVTTIAEMRAGNYGVGVMGIYNMLDFDYIGISFGSDGEEAKMVKITNSTDFDWERVNELMELGRSTTDVAERQMYYQELDDIIMDAAVMLPLFHTALSYAWDKNLVVNTDKSYTYQYTSFWDAYWTE
jgi:ABC-type transport system substrate-binding protein